MARAAVRAAPARPPGALPTRHRRARSTSCAARASVAVVWTDAQAARRRGAPAVLRPPDDAVRRRTGVQRRPHRESCEGREVAGDGRVGALPPSRPSPGRSTGPSPGSPSESSSEPAEVLWSERFGPPWWAWLVATGFAASVGLVAGAAITTTAGWATGLGCAAVVVVGLLAASRTVLRVTGGDGPRLSAGPAVLDLLVVARAVALDRTATVALRGTELDPLAHLVVRASRPRAVRLDLADPRDPTPYWTVSTRSPELLVAAIARARGADAVPRDAGPPGPGSPPPGSPPPGSPPPGSPGSAAG